VKSVWLTSAFVITTFSYEEFRQIKLNSYKKEILKIAPVKKFLISNYFIDFGGIYNVML